MNTEETPGAMLGIANTTPSDPCADNAPRLHRTRAAWLVNKKQELLAPASAILDLNDILIKDARDRGQDSFVLDLTQIHSSGQRLLAMAHQLLDPANPTVAQPDFAHRVRHDLRTPLTHIIGLCEIWLEDAADLLLEGFVNDLRRIHALGKESLVSIDGMLEFGEMTTHPDFPPDAMIADVVESLTPSSRPQAAPNTGKLLVVDDNEINRDILQRRLTRAGHQVTLAENGRQALDILRTQPFDLILLDIIMPELNGYQVLQHLKSDEALRHVPVIMISALGEVDSVVRCIEQGAEDYLSKPFNPVLLQARINACLEKKRLRDREVLYLEEIQKERRRADELLHVILPGEIVKELKETDAVRPRRFDNVAVLFCDIVNFTPFCDRSEPEHVVAYLQQLTEAWEEIALRHQVEKIKTIGDAFMAAAGLLQRTTDHPVLHCVRCGLEMIAACQSLPLGWNLRVGIHVGPVIAGVIGRRQYLFDLWGDTVNTAARMESHGVPGAVVLSGAAWQTIAPRCRGESRGILSIKGKPPMETFRFDGLLTASGE
jgi:class 3 adenylate cyclase/CheY-like chemotaxis protein